MATGFKYKRKGMKRGKPKSGGLEVDQETAEDEARLKDKGKGVERGESEVGQKTAEDEAGPKDKEKGVGRGESEVGQKTAEDEAGPKDKEKGVERGESEVGHKTAEDEAGPKDKQKGVERGELEVPEMEPPGKWIPKVTRAWFDQLLTASKRQIDNMEVSTASEVLGKGGSAIDRTTWRPARAAATKLFDQQNIRGPRKRKTTPYGSSGFWKIVDEIVAAPLPETTSTPEEHPGLRKRNRAVDEDMHPILRVIDIPFGGPLERPSKRPRAYGLTQDHPPRSFLDVQFGILFGRTMYVGWAEKWAIRDSGFSVDFSPCWQHRRLATPTSDSLAGLVTGSEGIRWIGLLVGIDEVHENLSSSRWMLLNSDESIEIWLEMSWNEGARSPVVLALPENLMEQPGFLG
ncbi:hypothetical protein BDD12DRAFT_807332 [Trichophaea hybrida]|nr:hypothetical protein BDD12DRAFT_807332 [Trichophaea hybrida]